MIKEAGVGLFLKKNNWKVNLSIENNLAYSTGTETA